MSVLADVFGKYIARSMPYDMKELYNVRANVEHLLDIPAGREPQRESQKSRQ